MNVMARNWLHDPDVTNHINALIKGGSEGQGEELTQKIYDTLRSMSHHLSLSGKASPFEPTELVHEAFLVLLRQEAVTYENRSHFFGVASKLMRQILAQAWRDEASKRRGGDYTVIPLDDDTVYGTTGRPTVLAFDQALTWLEQIDSRKVRVVELRVFSGLKHSEIAELLNISVPTVERLWRLAKAFLIRRLAS